MFNEKGSGVAPEKVNVVGYARVSTEEQAKGHSTESQIHYLKEWSKEKGWNYTKSYIDNGYSGGNEKRPALQEMLEAANKGLFNGVILSHTDRLSRNATFAYNFFEQMNKINIRVGALNIMAYGLVNNLDDPNLNLMIRIGAAFDEYFRKTTIFKTKAGLKRLKEQGKHIGRIPNFFTINKRTGKLVAEDFNTLTKFRNLVKLGYGKKRKPYGFYSKIAKELGLDYWVVYRAVQDYEKYKEITK